jgi:hypothetical protein
MSEPERDGGGEGEPEDGASKGPNLAVFYSLIVLALVLAIGFAALIVMPFYQRR